MCCGSHKSRKMEINVEKIVLLEKIKYWVKKTPLTSFCETSFHFKDFFQRPHFKIKPNLNLAIFELLASKILFLFLMFRLKILLLLSDF